MKLPLTWLKDFVDIDLNDLETLARTITMLGLEVEEIHLAGLSMPEGVKSQFKVTGLSWDRDKFVVEQIEEVRPHPQADRLVLCEVNDGKTVHTVLTGAPSLLAYKDQGPLPEPFKVAYAYQGAQLYDGHQPGFQLVTLKPARIRGVESSSMVCSEKELGISELHGDIIYLDEDAPVGMPLVDYMGDAVFELDILPNMIRNACVFGVAREVAAVTGKALKQPETRMPTNGPSVKGEVSIIIQEPELNPRFVLGLVRDVKSQPSPYWVQRRLTLAGMRPINGIVDATNYAMLEIGEPLHAFDYDILVERAGGKTPTIITRRAEAGEKLTTLDDIERTLEDYTVLVTDTAGSLSIAGVMGGAESEVHEGTRNVLLEGAAWNYVNVRRTISALHMTTEAAYRFSRGVHPELSRLGVQQCLDYIAAWSGGQIAADLVDEYPLKAVEPVVELTIGEINRRLGIEIQLADVVNLLSPLGFECSTNSDSISVKTPPYRLDISEGVVGKADILEEIARMYGYDRIPATRLADALPPQRRNPLHEGQERLRDMLVSLGLQEVISYRLTSKEAEARLLPPGVQQQDDYVTLLNPIAPERNVLRRSLLTTVLEAVEVNARLSERKAFFELGPVFHPVAGEELPQEKPRVAIALTGVRRSSTWADTCAEHMDFYDMKGIIEALMGMNALTARYEPAQHPSFHPGKCARVIVNDMEAGVFGELHPLVRENFEFGAAPVMAAELDVSCFLDIRLELRSSEPVPAFPPVLEDIAVILDEDIPAERVVEVVSMAGGKLLAGVRLFDIYRGPQIGEGKKSLAYSLVYQAEDRTLTDKEVAKVRKKIIHKLAQDLGAKLRS